jgi:hypothetical protein
MEISINNKNFRLVFISEFAVMLKSKLSNEYLNINKNEILKVLKQIYKSKFTTELILVSQEKLYKIFKFFVEKRKRIYCILESFNKHKKYIFKFEEMNLFIEYFIFFSNLDFDDDINIELELFILYEKLIFNITKYPLLYPEFNLY